MKAPNSFFCAKAVIMRQEMQPVESIFAENIPIGENKRHSYPKIGFLIGKQWAPVQIWWFPWRS